MSWTGVPPAPRCGDDTAGGVVGIVVAAHRSARGGYLLLGTRTPEDEVLVAVLHGSGRIDTQVLDGAGTWTSAGFVTLPGEPQYGVLLAVGVARERLIAIGGLDGTLRYWRHGDEGRQPLPGHRRATATPVVADGQVHLVPPWTGPSEVLPTSTREQRFAVGYREDRPIAAVFAHEVGGPVVRLHSSTDAGFEPLTEAWRVPGSREAAVTGTAGGALLPTFIRNLGWTDDHRLAVRCEAGVLELDSSRSAEDRT